MKAIQKPNAAPGFSLAEVPMPTVGPGEVRIRVALASICGTDLHITHWDEWSASRIKTPLVYGHEFCGFVDAVGEGVTHIGPGDYVSAEMHIVCGTCYYCMIGKRHICQNLKIAGVDQDGCFAEYVVLPKYQIVPLPGGLAARGGGLFGMRWEMQCIPCLRRTSLGNRF